MDGPNCLVAVRDPLTGRADDRARPVKRIERLRRPPGRVGQERAVAHRVIFKRHPRSVGVFLRRLAVENVVGVGRAESAGIDPQRLSPTGIIRGGGDLAQRIDAANLPPRRVVDERRAVGVGVDQRRSPAGRVVRERRPLLVRVDRRQHTRAEWNPLPHPINRALRQLRLQRITCRLTDVVSI